MSQKHLGMWLIFYGAPLTPTQGMASSAVAMCFQRIKEDVSSLNVSYTGGQSK